MTKRKRGAFEQSRRQPIAPCDERLALLSRELVLAGLQVLTEEYGFTPEKCDEWMGKMLARAQANREGMAIQNIEAAMNDPAL